MNNIENISLEALEKLTAAKPLLTLRQLVLLISVFHDKNSYSVKDYAKKLKISCAAVTRSFDVLVTLGFIERRTGRKDRRLIELLPTSFAKSFLEENKVL